VLAPYAAAPTRLDISRRTGTARSTRRPREQNPARPCREPRWAFSAARSSRTRFPSIAYRRVPSSTVVSVRLIKRSNTCQAGENPLRRSRKPRRSALVLATATAAMAMTAVGFLPTRISGTRPARPTWRRSPRRTRISSSATWARERGYQPA
jgi:hypothetical protein